MKIQFLFFVGVFGTLRVKIIQYFRYAFLILAVGLFAGGYLLNNFNVMLCGVMALFLGNVFYCFTEIRSHILLFVFHITIFVFLLDRPFISMLRGEVWWYPSVAFSLNVLFLSLIFLQLGAAAGNRILKKKLQAVAQVKSVNSPYQMNFRIALQVVSLAFFALTMLFYLMVELEKLQFMQGREYEELYSLFESQLPSFVHTLAAMMKYSLCIFLATLPSKRMAFVPLAFFLISAVPSLLTGVRNPIVLNALFILVYYILRDVLENGSRWLGKAEKACLILVAPVALVFLSAYNYIRAGEKTSMGVFDSVVDLFYKQGVSFDVLGIGYESLPNLPDVVPKNYTFGPFTDYFFHNTLAQRLFGAMDLGSGNSVDRAVYGSSFSHSMSYVARDDYLQGHGWGSSYLLETYADWGYLGVIIASFLFGLVMLLMMLAIRKGIMARTITLVGLTSLYFVPRAETTGWLLFLVTIQFWLTVVFCYVVAGLFARSYSCEGNRSMKRVRKV